MAKLKYDYEKVKQALFHKNLAELEYDLKKNPLPDYVVEKVSNFCDNFGFKEDDVIKELRENNFLAAKFIKDPGRQNFYEKQAKEWLSAMHIVDSVEKLSANGNNAMYIIQGVLKSGSQLTSSRQNNKSIDFLVTLCDNTKLYISHKYTKDEGGAQNNQRDDLINFLNNAKTYKGEGHIIALADGKYYSRNNCERLNELKEIAASMNNVHALSIETFEEYWRDKIK